VFLDISKAAGRKWRQVTKLSLYKIVEINMVEENAPHIEENEIKRYPRLAVGGASKDQSEVAGDKVVDKVVDKGPKGGVGGDTRPLDPPSTSPPSDDLKSTKNRVLKKLALAQDLLLDKIEAMLREQDPEKQPTLGQLINALTALADIRLTQEWTDKLKKAIERNPTNLTAPNVPAPLLNRLKGLAGGLRKAQKGDGREGRNKLQAPRIPDLPED
jgi:hypothetical protein